MFLDGSTPTCVLRSVSGSRELAPADAPVAAGHWGSRSKAGRATRQRVHLGCWMTTPALQYLFSASDLSTSYTSDVLSLLELVKFLRMMAICTVISATSPVSSRVFTQSFHPEFSPCFPSFPHILPAFPMYFPPARTICSSPAQCSSIASSRAADTVARSATSSQASETFACHSAKASSQAMATVGFTNGGEIHKNFLGIWMEYERNMNVIWYKWINIWDIHGINMNGIWIKSRIWYLGVTLK